MSFLDDVRRFAAATERRARDIHADVSELAFASIVEGSPITGAPGQPVDTGYLKGSWQNIIEGPLVRLIVTRVAYAPVIEERSRGAFDARGTVGERRPVTAGGTRRLGPSQVGGNYSVRLTRNGWRRLVEAATLRQGGGRGA